MDEENQKKLMSENDRKMMEVPDFINTENESREGVLQRWENVESMTDEELLDAMRHDGQLLIHMTAFAKEAVEEGYLVPTRIINERSGKDPGEKAVLHPSAAVHFGLNRVFTDHHFINLRNPGNRPAMKLLFTTFVSHPGIQMTDHDFSVELPAVPNPDIQTEFFKELQLNDSHLIDVMVRGRSDDPWDLTQDIDIRSGFFLVPNLRINSKTLVPVSQWHLTREEYEKWVHFDEEKQVWRDNNNQTFLPPDQYEYAFTTRDCWEQIISSLPEGRPRPRVYFYDGDTPSVGIAQFRQHFNIPEPNADLLISQINAVGSSEVIHKINKNDLNFSYGSGEGHAIRLNSDNVDRDSHLPLGGINLGQLGREESQRQYDSIKLFIEVHHPGPDWYQAQYESAYHHLVNLREKLNSAYEVLRRDSGEDKANENLIHHLAPELVKARARLEEIGRFWSGFIHDLEKQNWKDWEEPKKREIVDVWDR